MEKKGTMGSHGRRLGRFELVAEMATSDVATFYLGRLTEMGGFQRLIAIKRLHPHLMWEPEIVEAFVESARLAALVRHPNVVPVLEVNTGDAGYYIVSEHVQGATLARLLTTALRSSQSAPSDL